MVSWDCKDQWVVTACSDHTLKVWDSFSGNLLQILSGHKDEVFVLEGHPHDSQVINVRLMSIHVYANYYEMSVICDFPRLNIKRVMNNHDDFLYITANRNLNVL